MLPFPVTTHRRVYIHASIAHLHIHLHLLHTLPAALYIHECSTHTVMWLSRCLCMLLPVVPSGYFDCLYLHQENTSGCASHIKCSTPSVWWVMYCTCMSFAQGEWVDIQQWCRSSWAGRAVVLPEASHSHNAHWARVWRPPACEERGVRECTHYASGRSATQCQGVNSMHPLFPLLWYIYVDLWTTGRDQRSQ